MVPGYHQGRTFVGRVCTLRPVVPRTNGTANGTANIVFWTTNRTIHTNVQPIFPIRDIRIIRGQTMNATLYL